MRKESYRSSGSNIHFRVYGEGPAIALFHPSPNSSLMMHDLAIELSDNYTVICPDTPGYGTSPKLEIDDPKMEDYADAFHQLFQELGFGSIACYGSATGAQIAIRYGIKFPEAVSHLYLDNCAHFTSEEREKVLENYFPDLTPQMDGSHLVMLWDMVSSLFQYFPWCFKDEEHMLSGPVPPAGVLDAIAQDYLRAGANYDIAYKAAFEHEKIDYIQLLKVPTTVLRWEGSILKKYTDRIFDFDLPANVSGQKISADRSLRYKEIADHISESYVSDVSFSEAKLKLKLEANNKVNIDSKYQHKPPAPDLAGLYLIRAWHELKDQEYLFTNQEIKSESQDAIGLQNKLLDWFSEYSN